MRDIISVTKVYNRPLARRWECSQSEGQKNKISIPRRENFICFAPQIGCIPTMCKGSIASPFSGKCLFPVRDGIVISGRVIKQANNSWSKNWGPCSSFDVSVHLWVLAWIVCIYTCTCPLKFQRSVHPSALKPQRARKPRARIPLWPWVRSVLIQTQTRLDDESWIEVYFSIPRQPKTYPG